MKGKLTAVPLLLWLLGVEPLTPTAAQAQGLTLALRTDQATYPMGSQATVILLLRSTTPMTGETTRDAPGCDWNIVILDATGTTVFSISYPSRCVSYRSLLSFCGGAMRKRPVQEGL